MSKLEQVLFKIRGLALDDLKPESAATTRAQIIDLVNSVLDANEPILLKPEEVSGE